MLSLQELHRCNCQLLLSQTALVLCNPDDQDCNTDPWLAMLQSIIRTQEYICKGSACMCACVYTPSRGCKSKHV